MPTSKHGSCSKSKVQEKEKVSENVVKEKKGIATSVPPISLILMKKVVEEEKVKEEEVIATRPPISKRVIVDGSSFSFQLPLELFGIPRKSYILREDVITLLPQILLPSGSIT
ncbi:uncharacterized protein E5676_scaffold461G00210 [Cucumis melo var. makuwa]|uniref:Uncharacterized protein n=1 Tax=Cucumis melo var. makuwa TaxID=1194695 RepID=A0A5D3CTS5_CUCMM|nr:uncharacterized protein E5676_scaffold461G00210 [Cucumis melo var. makuwa]